MFLIRFLAISAILISEVFSIPQHNTYEIFEIELDSPKGNQYQNNPFLSQPTSYKPYQNNPFFDSPNNNNANHQTSSSSQSCDSLSSLQQDYNEKWGLITIPDPFYLKSVIRVSLSLAAKLQTVSYLVQLDSN